MNCRFTQALPRNRSCSTSPESSFSAATFTIGFGYVYVSESPYFAKTGADGKAMISELPPRAYIVRVWHPQLEAAEETTRENVDASRMRRVDVTWKLMLKPEVKVKRGPLTRGGGGY